MLRLVWGIFFLAVAAASSDSFRLGQAFPEEISEEEALSFSLPSYLLCDGCRAVAFELARGFHRRQRHHDKRFLADSEIIDIADRVCSRLTFDEYGVDAAQRRRLVGPAFVAAKQRLVVLASGKFPFRLAQLCQSFLELDEASLDELALYAHWVRLGRTEKALQKLLCHNPVSKATSSCINET